MSADDDMPEALGEVSDIAMSLEGQMLIAMPSMSDERFERSVIFMCAHSDQGAMGIIVNKRAHNITFPDLLSQLNIATGGEGEAIGIHFGGPVETGRGFVLHTTDYHSEESTLRVSDFCGLTATIDILKAMARGRGPRESLVALGYAGWGPGQLESEINANGWLHCPADEALLFGPALERKWERAIAKIGVDVTLLSGAAGHA